MKKILPTILIILVLSGIVIGYIVEKSDSYDKELIIEKIVLPSYLSYIDLGEQIKEVEYVKNEDSIKIYFNEELNDNKNLDIFFMICGNYSHIKNVNNKNNTYKDNYSYEIEKDVLKITSARAEIPLPSGLTSLNIVSKLKGKDGGEYSTINKKPIYFTSEEFTPLYYLEYLNGYEIAEKPTIILKQYKDNPKKYYYITTDTKMYSDAGNIDLIKGTNVELIDENKDMYRVYYPCNEKIEKINKINHNINIYESEYVTYYEGKIDTALLKEIPKPQNERTSVLVYSCYDNFGYSIHLNISNPITGYYDTNVASINNGDITIKDIEEHELVSQRIFYIPNSYWMSYVVDGEKLSNLDIKSQPYISSKNKKQIDTLLDLTIDYFETLKIEWGKYIVSEENYEYTERVLDCAEKRLNFEIAWLKWINYDQMTDLKKLAEKIVTQIDANEEEKDIINENIMKLQEDYSKYMSIIINNVLQLPQV